jgi:DNA-binding beta-propeller fold protein YncE
MKNLKTFAGLIVLSLSAAACSVAAGAGAPAPVAFMKLVHTVPLPGYSGDFDHFAVDTQRGRLLLAAEDHGTLEVFELKTGRHLQTVKGFDAPHSILVRPSASTILVTDSGKSMTKVLDAETYNIKGSIKLTEGADSAAYDPRTNVYYIVTGGKDVDMKTANVEAINPDTGQRLGGVTFNDNHVEAIALEEHGNRIFVNLTQTNKIAVVDRKTMKEIAEWPVPPAQQNAMVALDEAQHRLYVVCRADSKGSPAGTVVVMNSDDGKVVATQEAPTRVDQVIYDVADHRLYVPGGQGFTAIYDTSDANHLKTVAKVTTAPGAKTGIMLPDKKLALAASPGDTKAMAKVMYFSIP